MTPDFLHGGLTVTSLVIGILFLKFWVVSRDRLYVWFVAAFWSFSAGWAIRSLVEVNDEHAHLVYVPRLVGFTLILVAIIDKNRRSGKTL